MGQEGDGVGARLIVREGRKWWEEEKIRRWATGMPDSGTEGSEFNQRTFYPSKTPFNDYCSSSPSFY